MRKTVSRLLIPVSLSAALFACSSDERRGSFTEETTAAPKPAGAVNMEVYATAVQTCPPGNIHIDIGNNSASPPLVYEDGQDGAAVTCAVLSDGSKFHAEGNISKGAFSFSFRDVVTDGASAVGHVEFTDPASGAVYASTDLSPCVFQFAPSSEQGISAGKIFVQFDCSNLVSSMKSSDACSSRYGYVRLEYCAGSP